MSLTTGRGPHSADPAGRFVQVAPGVRAYVEPFPRRVRGLKDGRTVVDSEQVVLVHRQGSPPTYAFPAGDVSGIVSDDEPAAPGYVRVAWEAADAWFEEEEQVHLHPRNPYHRVDCVRTRRRLRVEVAGTVLVDTDDTMGVYETSLPPRLYVDRRHLLCDVLVASPTVTHCPYKGWASYWSAAIGGTTVADVAWSYEDPTPESQALGGLLGFDEVRATVQADLPR